MATRKKTTTTKKTASGKFNFLNDLHEGLLQVTESGKKLKRSDVKSVLEGVFTNAAVRAAKGEKVRFPVIGALVRKDVPARKAKKGVNPFTNEPMMIKARPASKKPRWSFPKSLKELMSNKKYW